MEAPLNIYNYTDYRKFLLDFYESEKARDPDRISYRYLARKAGFASSNFLHLVITNRRNLSYDSIQRVARVTKLSKRETLFFENLVHFNQVKDNEEKNHAYKKMLSFREYRHARQLSEEEFSYFSKWYYPAIREMVHLSHFKESPEWIANTLVPKISIDEAAKALKHLLQLGLLKRNKAGRLMTVDKNIASGDDVVSTALTSFHQQMIENGKKSLEHAPNIREISAMTMSLSEKQFEMIKEKIREFQRDVQQMIDAGEGAKSVSEVNRVCQLNFQLFSLIKEVE